MIKILHTSDWHLGQNFMTKSRKAEHEAFFEWLLEQLEKQEIDLLLVSGDIFDTTTPPNYALQLYYNFLTKAATKTKKIIITAGNHDSIATLKATQQLLETLGITVVTTGEADEKRVVGVYKEDTLECIVCAAPFLRDFVVRESVAHESFEAKEKALQEGIVNYYNTLYNEAKEISTSVPLVAMGHLTTLGSVQSDSERDIYIGGSFALGSSFLEQFDYVALGHLHQYQKISKKIYYSGSVIPLSFSEASQQKKCNIITLDKEGVAKIEPLSIPVFQKLYRIKGSKEQIIKELENEALSSMWLEIIIQDPNPFDAHYQIRQIVEEKKLTVLAYKTDTMQTQTTTPQKVVSLEELTPKEVFATQIEELEEAMQEVLMERFLKVVEEVKNEDPLT